MDWGTLQETNSSGANYARVRVSSGGSLRDTAIGDDRIVAYLDEFGARAMFSHFPSVIWKRRRISVSLSLKFGPLESVVEDLQEGRRRKSDPTDADTPIELLGKVYHATGIDEDSDDPDTADRNARHP